ncbi:MAG: helix-turn-helix domain-containing protein [Pyrinomonadaceae bacterium]
MKKATVSNEVIDEHETSEQSRLFSPKEICFQLAISRSTLTRLCRAGRLGYYKLSSNRLAFSSAHIEKFLASCEFTPPEVARPSRRKAA